MVEKAYKGGEVFQNKEISKGVYKLDVIGNFKSFPGQFYMLKAWKNDPLLPRPFSVCDISGDKISFLYEVVGKGTEIMKKLKTGDNIELLGPLGNSFDVKEAEGKKVAIITGGVGIAPMLYLVKNLKANVDLYAGFREIDFFIDEFKSYINDVYISTNSGKVGHKGFITEIVKKDFYDIVYSCGPTPMLKSVKKLNLNIPTYISTESRMGCGIGACLACSTKTVNGMKRICKEGPIFEVNEVIFNDEC